MSKDVKSHIVYNIYRLKNLFNCSSAAKVGIISIATKLFNGNFK